jgi:hypothetical protein
MITDNFLNQLAGVMNGEAMGVPSHIGFSSTALVLNPVDSTLSGEYLTRVASTGSRVLNKTTFNALRSGAVASSTGNIINAIGLFDASTSGDLYSEALVPSLLHTTSFDFEIDWSITVKR